MSNHVPETNFPLKNLDGPSQGVRLGGADAAKDGLATENEKFDKQINRAEPLLLVAWRS